MTHQPFARHNRQYYKPLHERGIRLRGVAKRADGRPAWKRETRND